MNNDNQSDDKKHKMMQYGYWIIGVVFAAVAIFILVNVIGGEAKSPYPDDYKFVIEDHYAHSDAEWATYYVYDSYVIVKKDGEADKNKPARVYDSDFSGLKYKESDTTRICDEYSCYNYPKILKTIKSMISNKTGREYIRR